MHDRKGYVCGRYKIHGKNACTSHLIREKQLENLILEDLRELECINRFHSQRKRNTVFRSLCEF
nr:zinc ribbon domain-containing protein [Fredinandcohnia onubensis]